jgi:large subunit ribosomal protein L18
MARTNQELRQFRRKHVRSKISGSATRPRLAVFRSLSHISAQLIDDQSGTTIAAASTQEKDLRAQKASLIEKAAVVGKRVAERAKAKSISELVFDRGGFRYHGKVKAVAEAAREEGMKF